LDVIKDYLKETLDLGRDDVFKVDVKEGFSFFNTDPEHTDKVMEVLNNVQLEGRRVEISKNDGGGRRDHNGRSSGGGGFGGGRSSAPRREGSFAPRREEAVVEATETQVQRRWIWWKKLCSKRRRFLEEVQLRGEGSSDRAQDVLKVW
jgi:ATP-dependent RNA helicase DeaD